ncbi:hypothetical protein PISMIDRAFT_551491 [Pisolithus microcarpus 441]|uniref:Uncharacterized protein n=1 Tax=Pisolithus microcarpus 441 TaxID=765257 RepID=A0A0C9YUM6_9AGAM|nr:hypothetical protein BKA83DRAFT_551491 [Pisolithus microcarpus]KIK28740.1 hypothetical protein PISMIDRAFT_551491 [Pisolithus microcarpus 441]
MNIQTFSDSRLRLSEVDDCSMNDGAVLYALPLHTLGFLIVHSIVYFITQAFQLTLEGHNHHALIPRVKPHQPPGVLSFLAPRFGFSVG